MTELFRCRIDRSLLKEAEKVTQEIGTTPGDVVRMTFTQLVKRRAIPFPITADAPVDALVDVERRNQIWRDLDDAEDW